MLSTKPKHPKELNFGPTKYLGGWVGCREHWQQLFILQAFVRPGFDQGVEASLKEALLQFLIADPHGISVVRVLAQKASTMLEGLDASLHPANYGVLPS